MNVQIEQKWIIQSMWMFFKSSYVTVIKRRMQFENEYTYNQIHFFKDTIISVLCFMYVWYTWIWLSGKSRSLEKKLTLYLCLINLADVD